jgi:hypothetical protein
MWQWTSCLKPIGVGNASQDGNVLIPTLADFLVMLGKNQAPITDAVKLDRLWTSHQELHHA